MKNNRISEFRNMGKEELFKELESARAKLFGIRCQKVVGGGTPNYRSIQILRKEIARILTVLNESTPQ